eukprot:TRINITY_DN37476_c0_g1_i1.p1 TRINITY_DN37476_c0_g1~~TRINITY_DN37476_c0_g1_i1.p1  ORF type:complete len:160 (+),score=15.34 TRINITY_DN37476_c0_g1_i1:62-541(+)
MSNIWLSRAHERKLEILKQANVDLNDAALKDLVSQSETTPSKVTGGLLSRAAGDYWRIGGCGSDPTKCVVGDLLYENELNRVRISGNDLLVQRKGSTKWFRHMTLSSKGNEVVIATPLHIRPGYPNESTSWVPWIGAANTVDALHDQSMGITWYRCLKQ